MKIEIDLETLSQAERVQLKHVLRGLREKSPSVKKALEILDRKAQAEHARLIRLWKEFKENHGTCTK